MYSYILAILLVLFLACGLPYIYKTRHQNGDKLKPSTKPYFNAVKKIIFPYMNTDFAKQVIDRVQLLLSSLETDYISFSKQGTIKEDDLCKLVVENCDNNFYVECFSFAYVFSFIATDVLRPSETEKFARLSIKDYCKAKILECGTAFPNELLDWFEIGNIA